MAETLVACEGGLDLRSSAINAPKGTLSGCYNYEKDQGPGYAKRLGWCRYDGRVQGPEHDAALVIFFNVGQLTGLFQYGEQVTLLPSGGFPSMTMIVIGFNFLSISGLQPFLVLAYPVTKFTNAVDVTGFPTNTAIAGLNSGASIATIISAKLMNDSTLTVTQYDAIKGFIQYMHAQSVLAVPGRNESPLDAIFTYNNNSYAIHDCVVLRYTAGITTGAVGAPLEGHCIRDHASGHFLGRILQIIGSGQWTDGGVAGAIVVYDYPLGQAFPAPGAALDLYDATNVTLLQATFALYAAAQLSADAATTRALLYTTYEQFVKDAPNNGTTLLTTQVAPPTWTRPRLGRELPYTCIGGASTLGFGPTGANTYSVYEYSRQGLTQGLGQVFALNTGEKAPTVAGEPGSPPHWINVNNIKVQDAVDATYPVQPVVGSVTDFVYASAFDFSAIPAGSIILGIQVRLHWHNLGIGVGLYKDSTVSLIGNNFPTGRSTNNYATNTPSVTGAGYADITYGSSLDMWHEQLTVAQIQDPSFGVGFQFQKLTVGAAAIGVDFIGMTVYYASSTRSVYIRDPLATTVTDVIANVIDYQIDSGDFLTSTATGVLTVLIGTTEPAGTVAGKARRIARNNEIRDAPSTGANVPHGNLLAYCAGEDYPISFPPSANLDAVTSRYEVTDANFWDLPNARAAYIVNGCEFCVQFDGTYFIRIHTGRPPTLDAPRHVTAHGSPTPQLYLGFQTGSMSVTAAGHPTHYLGGYPSVATFAFGEPITGLLSVNGQTLGVWTDRSTRGVQGTSPDPSVGGLTPFMISPAINCIEYTLVNLVGEAVWTSYRGVETLRTVNAYGDFETLPLSAAAQLWLQPRIQVDSRIGSRPSRALYAVGIRNKRQYKLFFEDGYYFCLTMFDAGDVPVCTTGRYVRPVITQLAEGTTAYNQEPWDSAVVRHVYNGTRSDGKELIFVAFENLNPAFVPAAGVGASNGPYFPYGARLDCGFNDDVLAAMPCYIEFNAIYVGHPAQMQQFQGGTIYAQAYGGTVFTVYTKTDFDGPIFDTANVSSSPLLPPKPQVYQQSIALPLIESQAFIPVPYRTILFDCEGEGRTLKIRIDGTQVIGLTPVVMPMRVTHINITTAGEAVPEA